MSRDNKIDNSIVVFFKLIRESILKKEPMGNNQIGNIDWHKVYVIALRHGLDGILFQTISTSSICKSMPKEIMSNWEKITKKRVLIEYRKYYAIRKLVEASNRQNVDLIFFKGCVLADLYPQYIMRYASDTDIYVEYHKRDEAIELIMNLGYVKDEEQSKTNVPVFINYELFHVIELHYALWEDYEGRRIEQLKKMDLINSERLITIEVTGIEVTTLGHQEHLIYQMFHIIKHFAIESIGARYLVDLTLFIESYKEEIDFVAFWESMTILGYVKYCKAFLGLCIEYIGLDPVVMQYAPKGHISNQEVLMLDIVNAGEIYKDKTAAWQLLGIMTPYMVGDSYISKSRVIRKLKVLFPSKRFMPSKYDYLIKYPWMLPIAWIHKFIDYYKQYKIIHKTSDDWYSANEKLTVAEYRLNLMKELGLVDK